MSQRLYHIRQEERSFLEVPLDRLGHALRKVLDVVSVQTSHRDTPVSSHVDVGLLRQRLCLRWSQTGETAKRASKNRSIRPVVRNKWKENTKTQRRT